MQRTALILFLSLAISGICKAQDSIPPEIRVEERGDSMHFSAQLRPLRQIAGAPASFYTYFWELGDGRFSFDKEPLYSYRDTGLYQVRLYATNNYDDGKAPPTRPRPVKIKKKTGGMNTWASHFFHGNGNIEMKINRNPRPGEDFITLIGYRNQSSDSLAGSIVLFYNERQFGQDGFALTEKRCYNGEDSSSFNDLLAALPPERPGFGTFASNDPDKLKDYGADARIWTDARLNDQESGSSGADAGVATGAGEVATEAAGVAAGAEEARSMLRSMQNTYKQHTVLHFPKIKQGEEKFLFLDMNTMPAMIQDTNATVTVTAMLIPDNPAATPELYQLEMQVVASHDPNRMQLIHHRINYRFMGKKKELTYKVNFQNTGKGPAKKISIGIAIPQQLNTSTITLKSMSPVCRWCDSAYNRQSCIDTIYRKDSVYFVFNNIYLPGLQQDGVTDKDSTKGFVEYSVRFKKKPKKIPFSSRAAIIFDKNEPVLTNKATARFIKGISPGIMVGYSALPSQGGYSAKGPLQFGYVLAPYAPSRPYFQVEIFAGLLQQDEFAGPTVRTQQDTAINGQKYLVTGRSQKTTTQRNSIEITPLHYRYNIGDWIGIGIGAMAQVNISEKTTVEKKVFFIAQQLPLNTMTAVSSSVSSVRWIGNWDAAPFADIQFGRVKTGPVLGLRYFRLLRGDITDRFFLYAGFKL
ncbi:MAG TPA: PKD domain-containing protein [Puia sp.]|nr:PKD domain-containing protein [Puia sp.]